MAELQMLERIPTALLREPGGVDIAERLKLLLYNYGHHIETQKTVDKWVDDCMASRKLSDCMGCTNFVGCTVLSRQGEIEGAVRDSERRIALFVQKYQKRIDYALRRK